jgi:hypothetical protein
MFTEQLTEGQAIAVAVPTTLNGTSIDTLVGGNGMNMGGGGPKRVRAILNVGAVTGGGSLNFSIQASATKNGTYAAITNLTTNPTLTGITTANQPNALEIRADQLPAGKPWVKAIVTETGNQNVLASITLTGDCCQYDPGSQFDTVTWTNNVVAAV